MIDLRSRTVFQFVILFLAGLLLIACGGNGTYSPTTVASAPVGSTVAISIYPPSANTVPGGTVQFTATVTGTTNTAVTWSVVGQGVGTISSSGLYTAPSASEEIAQIKGKSRVGQIVTIQAVSQADPTKSATATVIIGTATAVAVTISPSPASTFPTGTIQFSATVSGTANQSVTWSVLTPNGGTITSTGLFTAAGDDSIVIKKLGLGQAKPRDGTCVVQATSVFDPTKSATVTITISDLLIAVTPQNPTVLEGQTVQFSATVTGPTTNHTVQWLGDDGGGTINQTTGLLTAGYKPGEYQIIAYSQAQNGDQGYSDFTVVPPSGITISVSPQNAFVQTGGTLQFTAKVGGTPDQNVTWAIASSSYVGTFSSTGLYTAPSSTYLNQTYTIKVSATSEADPTKIATSTFTVGPGT